jgi:hypothetical protein
MIETDLPNMVDMSDPFCSMHRFSYKCTANIVCITIPYSFPYTYFIYYRVWRELPRRLWWVGRHRAWPSPPDRRRKDGSRCVGRCLRTIMICAYYSILFYTIHSHIHNHELFCNSRWRHWDDFCYLCGFPSNCYDSNMICSLMYCTLRIAVAVGRNPRGKATSN